MSSKVFKKGLYFEIQADGKRIGSIIFRVYRFLSNSNADTNLIYKVFFSHSELLNTLVNHLM